MKTLVRSLVGALAIAFFVPALQVNVADADQQDSPKKVKPPDKKPPDKKPPTKDPPDKKKPKQFPGPFWKGKKGPAK